MHSFCVTLTWKGIDVKKISCGVAVGFILFSGSTYSGDYQEVIVAATKINGNASVGINTSSGRASLKSQSSGAGSTANAGVSVANQSGKSGKNLNLSVGYNSGRLDADARAIGGGVANAAVSVANQKGE